MAHSPMLYLDNDLQHKLSLQPGVAQLIVEQIFRDSDFLTRKYFGVICYFGRMVLLR